MKKLFKVAAVSALTLVSVSAFAASQQAEEVKKNLKLGKKQPAKNLKQVLMQLLLPLQVAMRPQLKLLLQNLIKKQQNM